MNRRAHAQLVNLLEKAEDRDPDAHDMYIYNGYFGYGVLDLVDKTLSKINAQIKKHDDAEMFALLMALTVFFELESVWTSECTFKLRIDAF